MLRISKLADYAIVVMQQLTLTPSTLLSAADIAERAALGVPTVSKLLKKLQEAGLVTAVRGVAGGYQLTKSAEQITIAEIIVAIEGEMALTECAGQHSSCSQQKICGTRNNWQLINKVIMNALSSINLAEMTKSLVGHPLVVQNINFDGTVKL